MMAHESDGGKRGTKSETGAPIVNVGADAALVSSVEVKCIQV